MTSGSESEEFASTPKESVLGDGDDAFVMEVTSLDDHARSSASVQRRPQRLLRPACLPRNRQARALGAVFSVLLVVFVGLGLVLRSAPDPTAQLATLTHWSAPTPTPTLGPGADVVLLANTVPWGHLTVDGRPVALVQFTAVGQSAVGVRLTRGQHHLVYTAAGFPMLHCVESVPTEPSDSCPYDTASAVGASLSVLNLPYALAIDAGATPERMQRGQYDALVAAINDALTHKGATATLNAGDHYLEPNGATGIAMGGERFGVSFALSLASPGRMPCAYVCVMGPFPSTVSAGASATWALEVNIAPAFTITDARGRTSTLLGDSQPPLQIQVGVAFVSGKWRVTLVKDPSDAGNIVYGVVANAAWQQATALANANTISGPTGMYVGQQLASGLQGCVLEFAAYGSQPTPLLLWRYGALSTANEAARQVFPTLPVANQTEQTVAQSILPQGA